MSLSDFDDVPAFQLAADSSASEDGWLFLNRLGAMKQEAVAREAGIDPGQFSKILKGELGLSLRKLKPLLDALGLQLVDSGARVIDQRDFESMARAAATLYGQAPHLLLKG